MISIKKLTYSVTLFSLVSAGCAQLEQEEDSDEDKAGSRSCSQRYIPSGPRVDNRSITYNSARSCTGSEQPGARELGNFIRSTFESLIDLNVDGRGIQIYNCRNVSGSSTRSLHSEGRAIDVFIPTASGWTADNGKGDIIANWLIDNSEELGVQQLIWDKTIWRPSQGSASHRCYTGDSPHVDHIHVELSWAAARKETAFFTRGASILRDPPPIPTAWIGEPCQSSADCISSSALTPVCMMGNSTQGVCTVPCEGFCADRAGHPNSFCVAASVVGGTSGGYCLLQATGGVCSDQTPSFIESHSRYVGSSGARSADANVCVPLTLSQPSVTSDPVPNPDPAPVPDPVPNPDPAPVPDPDPMPDPNMSMNNGICDDPSLVLSLHDDPCPDFPENYWRCACSEVFDTSISQVCRNGRWINYTTDPVDCSRCAGNYTSGCEKR